MRQFLLVLILAFFMLPSNNSAYPIPVYCKNGFHLPTISSAPISQHFGHLGHVGIDCNVPTGTEVYSIRDGIVMYAVEDSRVYGRSVYILGCDGYGTLYAHLSELKVKFGEIVTSGQFIGLSGGDPKDKIDGDGWSSGAHLHFEVRIPGHLENNLYNIDPMKYMDIKEEYRELPMEK